MKILADELNGVLLLEPKVWEDRRGFFLESYSQRVFHAFGVDTVFVQDNHSKSARHTLRGMHFQINPQPQAKLVRVVAGEIFDVVVDLRRQSPTFGRWAGFTLSAANRQMVLVPIGFAHGFCVLSESAEVLYKASDFYAPECERSFAWNDPQVGIRWPLTEPVLSERDRLARPFAELTDLF
jgi:dTDP-4-dehydrorhamnose 3,5-epimerase